TFAEKFDLPLVIDPFETADENKGDNVKAEAAKVRLPALVNVQVGTALRILCDQVNGAYLVRPDHIRIMHEYHALYETGVLKQPDSADPDETPPFITSKDLVRTKPLTHRALVT